MRLGNSFGNNRGKKYLRKNEVDTVYANKADHFNKWLGNNYNTLVLYLQERGCYNEDVFHQTYQNIYDKILFSDIKGNDYTGYIMRAYYTNYKLNSMKESRFCELLLDKEDINSEYFTEIEDKPRVLESDIYNYVFSKYDVREFEIFKMYMILKPAINYSSLSEITGMKSHEIQRIVSLIKKDIRSNKEFIKRRKELL